MPHREILIIVHDSIFDCTKFVPNHPGEGIHDVYLRNYKHKNATEDFDHYHFTDEPHDWIDNAKKKRVDTETGLAYVCPAFFTGKKIPAYFHFFLNDRNDELRNAYLAENPSNNVFIVTPFEQTSSQNSSAVRLTYRDGQGQLQHETLSKKQSENNNSNTDEWVDEHNNSAPNLEKLVDAIMIQKGFKGV